MDNCTKNAISNILYKYCIEKNESNFNKIAEVWLKKDIDIYRTIFQIINNCLIVDENTNYITIFIDSEQHRDLLNEISKKKFLTLVERKRTKFNSSLFFKVKILKC